MDDAGRLGHLVEAVGDRLRLAGEQVAVAAKGQDR